tara:strand:+ start:158 stop:832 length:675 start_codon:yes stop_codon:yes gene_type:complete
MKKILTLLLVITTLNSYSQTDSVLAYYKKVSRSSFNWDETTKKTVPNPNLQIKWYTDVFIYVNGEKEEYMIKEIEKVVGELNELINPINIYITDDPNKSNIELFLGSGEEYRKTSLSYKGFMESGKHRRPFGFFSYGGNNIRLTSGEILIDVFYIEEYGKDYEWDLYRVKNEIKCTIREEITQILGLTYDTWDYPHSIFYEGKITPVIKYANIDKELIKMLYNN